MNNNVSKKITPSGGTASTRYYAYDTGGNIVSEYAKNGETVETLVRYVRDVSGKAINMLQYPETQDPSPQPQTYYFVYNGHGDVMALADGTGTIIATYNYDEFGNLTSSTGSPYNPLRYAAAHNSYFDSETGFYKMGARYYQADIGHWLTRDPGKNGGDKTKSYLPNLYQYASNNPLIYVDPTGLAEVKAKFNGSRLRIYHSSGKLWKKFYAMTADPSYNGWEQQYGPVPPETYKIRHNNFIYRGDWKTRAVRLNPSAGWEKRYPERTLGSVFLHGQVRGEVAGQPGNYTSGCIGVNNGPLKWIENLTKVIKDQTLKIEVKYPNDGTYVRRRK